MNTSCFFEIVFFGNYPNLLEVFFLVKSLNYLIVYRKLILVIEIIVKALGAA